MIHPIHSTFRDYWSILLFTLLVLLQGGCKKEIVPKTYWPRSEHEAYGHSLVTANLAHTALGRDWIEGAARSLVSPVAITLPFQEAVYLNPQNPEALGYRFFVKRGLRIEVMISVQSADSLILFADLFRQTGDSIPDWIHMASADKDSLRLEFETRRDAHYVLRLQPELLRGGRFDIIVREVPSLDFPVSGRNRSSILSFFGDSRDGGKREHHGVDIFASRHTPVLAPIRAQVLRVGEGGIGGRYIWLYEPRRSLHLYFAHLETQDVKQGNWINPGDTIGTVGNSGNAIRTRPHLHFGIYNRGPVDPWNFIVETNRIPDRIIADTNLISAQVRLITPTIIRSGPNRNSQSIDTLDQHSIMAVTAATGKFYKILLPEGSVGYIPYDRIELVTDEIINGSISESLDLLETPEQKGIRITNLTADVPFQILGRYKDYYFVRTQQGIEGWMSVSSSLSI